MIKPPSAHRTGYEAFNTGSYINQMRRAVRIMHGHSSYEIVLQIDDDLAAFLADFDKLTTVEDRHDEEKLAASDHRLLSQALEMATELKAEKRSAVSEPAE